MRSNRFLSSAVEVCCAQVQFTQVFVYRDIILFLLRGYQLSVVCDSIIVIRCDVPLILVIVGQFICLA